MIGSKPAEPFLDHDHIEDSAGRIYIVVGNVHPPGAVVAYLKYVPTNLPTPWCRGRTCYERVVRRYGVDGVLGAISGLQEELYDPTLGVTMPVVRLGEVSAVYRPRERLEEVLARPRDPAELDTVVAFERIRSCSGVHPGSVGVDGSIAVGIHNPSISDVDLVVYGCREAVEVAETVQGSFDRLPPEVEARRLAGMAEIYRLPPEVLRAISPPYKRLYMRDRGREVNVMFASVEPGRYGERVMVPVALVEAELTVDPGDCGSLFYPGAARVGRVLDLRILGLLRRESVGSSRVSRIVTYESIYSYALYRGGELRVRGVLSVERPTGDLVITIGTRETHSYAVPRRIP